MAADQTSVFYSLWDGFEAVSAESSRLRVVCLPELGAKIVSLFDTDHNHEWLAGPMRPLARAPYGADFISQDMSGWDEMLPTINACRHQGIALPDHGEVWSLPWQVHITGGEIVALVEGQALPYRFTRALAFTAPDRLRLHYRLRNTGGESFPYLWAAHPQFFAGPQTRIVLPAEATRVINVMSDDATWGAGGQVYDWPAARDQGQKSWRLDRVRGVENRACRKFYLPPEQPVAWAGLLHEGKGCGLRLRWSPADLPYLGIWVDEGAYNNQPVAALEPSNAYYDSLERAAANGTAPWLEPGAEREWALEIILNDIPSANSRAEG